MDPSPAHGDISYYKFEPLKILRGLAYATLLLASSFLGTHFFLMPLMPLAVLRPALFRQIADFLIGFWLVLPSALMEFVFGVKVHVQGDQIDRDRPALLLMNHRTRLDWLFFWDALWRMDPWLLTTEKISLKRVLNFVPGAGWAMATNAFLFLDRTFTSDQRRIDSMINYYTWSKSKYQLLLFPEGTDKCPLATERSRKYAEKTGLVHYQYVLHPRTLGFAYLLRRMRKEKYIDFVYDITIAYGDNIVQSESDLILWGLAPDNVYFLVRKIPVSELPGDDKQLDTWLRTKWEQKEKLLHDFYLKREWPTSSDEQSLQRIELSPRGRQLQIGVLAIWLTLTGIWAYLFFYVLSFKLRWASALFTTVYFITLQLYYGGFELFLAWLSFRHAALTTSTAPISSATSVNHNNSNNDAIPDDKKHG